MRMDRLPRFVALKTIQIPADGDSRISAGHLNSTSMKLKGERLALTMLCSTPAFRAYELPMVSRFSTVDPSGNSAERVPSVNGRRHNPFHAYAIRFSAR